MELDVLAFVQTVNYNEFVVRVSSSLRRLEAAPSVVVVVFVVAAVVAAVALAAALGLIKQVYSE
jgi:hypothetical protein